MRDALSNVLFEDHADESTTRILAAAFVRKRPLQAGSSAMTNGVPRAARKVRGESGVRSFLQGGERR